MEVSQYALRLSFFLSECLSINVHAQSTVPVLKAAWAPEYVSYSFCVCLFGCGVLGPGFCHFFSSSTTTCTIAM